MTPDHGRMCAKQSRYQAVPTSLVCISKGIFTAGAYGPINAAFLKGD